jgi:hypothetical protein
MLNDQRHVFVSCHGFNAIVWNNVDSATSFYFDERTGQLVGVVDGGMGLTLWHGAVPDMSGSKEDATLFRAISMGAAACKQ